MTKISGDVEIDAVVAATTAVIKAVEGRRMVVLAEVFAILGAFWMSQNKALGVVDVEEAFRDHLADVSMHAIRHFRNGAIAASH